MNSSTISDPPAVLNLIEALTDESPWVRIGAAFGLAQVAPHRAAVLLRPRWDEAPANSFERWSLALALERCGADTLPLVAPLLGESPESVEAKMRPRSTHDEWVGFLRGQEGKIPGYGIAILFDIEPLRLFRQVRAAEDRRRVAEELPDPYQRAAQSLKNELSFWTGRIVAGDARRGVAGIYRPIRMALRSGDRDQVRRGVLKIVESALCEPRWWLRIAFQHTLPVLGEEASTPLLPCLWGEPPFVPSAEQIADIESEPGSHGDPPVGASSHRPAELAAFFAAETLARFTDTETIDSVVNLAVAAAAGTATRAELILAKMPLEMSLPSLFWAATNRADREEQRRAERIIEKILGKDSAYAIHFHQIGTDEVIVDIGWLLELIARCREIPAWAMIPRDGGSLSWTRDRAAADLVLRHAIRMMPYVSERVGIFYSEPAAWDRFAYYARRVRDLLGLARVEKKGPTRVARRLDCAFPGACLIGRRERLTVRLDLPTGKDGATGSPEVRLDFDRGQTEVNLLVLVRAPGFAVEPEYRPLRVPLDGPSEEVAFTLIADGTATGAHTIEVSLFRDAERVGYACVLTHVVKRRVRAGRAEASLIEGTGDRDLLRRGDTRAVVQVDWSKDGRLTYQAIDPAVDSGVPLPLGVSPEEIPPARVREWATQQAAIIKDYLREDSRSEKAYQGALDGLRSIGHDLFRQLAPPDLADRVRAWPANSIIAIESNDRWVPWELLTEAQDAPLWGERFQLVRVPRVPLNEDFDTARVVPVGAVTQPCIEVKRITSVVGDAIRRGQRPGEYDTRRTFGMAGQFVQEIVEATFPDFCEAARAADIIHFTCHGRAEPLYHLSLGDGAGSRLLVGQVMALDLRPGVVVFANACASDKAEMFLNEFQTLGWNFYLRGARPFIGTMGPVPTEHAIAFAQCFYKSFILDGLPAGQSMRQARQAMASAVRNPFFLFYCIYGPASACRRVSLNG